MTQAFNLAQLANNLNTSGQLDATDGLNGLVANANLASSGSASSSTYLRGDRVWSSLPALGKILQVVQTTKTDTFTAGNTGSFIDITGMSVNITPSSTSSRIFVFTSIGICAAYGGGRERTAAFRIYRNSTSVLDGQPSGNRIGVLFRTGNNNTDGNHNNGAGYSVIDSPNTTSTITYKLSVEVEDTQTFYLNRSVSDDNVGDAYGARTASVIIVAEIGA